SDGRVGARAGSRGRERHDTQKNESSLHRCSPTAFFWRSSIRQSTPVQARDQNKTAGLEEDYARNRRCARGRAGPFAVVTVPLCAWRDDGEQRCTIAGNEFRQRLTN